MIHLLYQDPAVQSAVNFMCRHQHQLAIVVIDSHQNNPPKLGQDLRNHLRVEQGHAELMVDQLLTAQADVLRERDIVKRGNSYIALTRVLVAGQHLSMTSELVCPLTLLYTEQERFFEIKTLGLMNQEVTNQEKDQCMKSTKIGDHHIGLLDILPVNIQRHLKAHKIARVEVRTLPPAATSKER